MKTDGQAVQQIARQAGDGPEGQSLVVGVSVAHPYLNSRAFLWVLSHTDPHRDVGLSRGQRYHSNASQTRHGTRAAYCIVSAFIFIYFYLYELRKSITRFEIVIKIYFFFAMLVCWLADLFFGEISQQQLAGWPCYLKPTYMSPSGWVVIIAELSMVRSV